MSEFWKDYEPEPTRPAPMTTDEFMEPLGCVVVRPLVANSTTPPAQPAPMTKDTALDLALEALEEACEIVGAAWTWRNEKGRPAITAIKQARSAPVQDSTCNNSLREQGKAYPRTCRKCGKGPCIALANAALDKKAENARELALDYEPVLKDNSNYRYDPPVAEPVAWMEMVTANLVREGVNKHKARELAEHFYTTPPAAQRQWVGLEREIAAAVLDHCYGHGGVSDDMIERTTEVIEAKLKEKNA